jgi:hypothetical protein
VLSVFILFIFITACSSDERITDPVENPHPLTFTKVIALGADTFESFPTSRTTDVLSESASANEDYPKEEEDGSIVTER